jgi:hypothetical protein
MLLLSMMPKQFKEGGECASRLVQQQPPSRESNLLPHKIDTMVLRQLLQHKEGGGSFRRFLALRKRLFLDQWNDSRPLRGPVPLLDIRRPEDST